MKILKEDIENILKTNPVNNEIVDYLSLQELAILVDIIYGVLLKEDETSNSNEDYNQRIERIGQNITKEVMGAEHFFGIKDFAKRLDIRGFLQNFYARQNKI